MPQPDVGQESPVGQQEREAEKSIQLIEKLHRENSDLQVLMDKLKDMIHRVLLECEGGETKPSR